MSFQIFFNGDGVIDPSDTILERFASVIALVLNLVACRREEFGQGYGVGRPFVCFLARTFEGVLGN